MDDLERARAQYEMHMELQAPSAPQGIDMPTATQAGLVAVAPNERHPVVLRRRGPICVRDHTGEPLRGKPYVLKVNGKTTTGTTDEQGWIEWIDTAVAKKAELHVADVVYHFSFDDESSDPVTHGQSMLNALGYSAGPLDGNAGPRTKSAVSYYQLDNDLEVTGEFDEATKAKLRSHHRVT